MISMSVRIGNIESMEGTSRAAESKSHRYHVFLNHRGSDVKNEFVSHLDAALRGDGLRTFLDAKDIPLCQDVDISIDEALKGSYVFVAIFSERYAESRHCLNELCKMMELTQLSDSKKILPVFYRVDPRDLRRIEDGPFKEGFRRHIEKETEEQILKWKDALCEITRYMGLRLEVKGNEAELVRRIVAEVQRLMDLMPIALPGAIEPPEAAEAPEVGEPIEGVEPPEEPVVTFNSGDRRLNCLVLGDRESVEAVIGHLCGAGRRQTLVKDHVNWRECRISLPPMCLYSHTDLKKINRNYLKDIRTFVRVKNKKWHPTEVVPLWLKEVRDLDPRNRPALFPDSTLRLHMVWWVCRKLSDLPNLLDWPEIKQMLHGLPVQILVIEEHDVQQEFNIIFENGSDYFPEAQQFMEKLIVKVDLKDDDLKEELYHKSDAVKTPAEIGNAAIIIREIRKKLGSAGKAFRTGVGEARMRKDVSLSRSGEFVLNFLCAYWDIPQDSLRRLLQNTTNFKKHERNSKFIIEPGKFVEFCLKVAAIILYNYQDNARNRRYVCSWDDSSESSLDQLLETEARECYSIYFPSSNPPDYNKMVFEDIRLFLESIFQRKDWDPRPHKDSFIPKFMKLIYGQSR